MRLHTPDDWRVTVAPSDDPTEILERFHRAEGVFLVDELAFSRRKYLRRQPLLPPLGRELPVLVRLLVLHGVGNLGLQPTETALRGAKPSNPHRVLRAAMGEVGPKVGLVSAPFPFLPLRAVR